MPRQHPKKIARAWQFSQALPSQQFGPSTNQENYAQAYTEYRI
jgi:sensor c-di-GMP phosphodiesterase-like protein